MEALVWIKNGPYKRKVTSNEPHTNREVNYKECAYFSICDILEPAIRLEIEISPIIKVLQKKCTFKDPGKNFISRVEP
ncbi:MAG: hypothetical protein MUF15_20135 [Acidobacteria bacterium]|jgi:hypothetical protein|nr:hypothetical protein [Acidobacteriota bacterium]